MRYEYRIPFLGGTPLNSEIKPLFGVKIPKGVFDALKSTNRERIKL